MLATCQLLGYGLIAVLALGTAERGDEAVVMALYDASAIAFVASNVGLALLTGATGLGLLFTGARIAGIGSVLVAIVAAGASLTYAAEGAFSPHGDLGFTALILQLLWTVAAAIALLRRSRTD